jgi:glycosyltransferase involved in cell wall biosynthesis
MRIAFFHHSLILGSGIDTGIYELARRLGRKHDVTVATFKSDYESIEPATLQVLRTSVVPSDEMGLFGIGDPRAWIEARRLLRTQDVVNVHTYPANVLAYRVSGVYHVATEWGAVDPSLFPTLRQRLYVRIAARSEAAYARSADLVIAPCRFTARWIVSRFGVEPATMYLDGINFDVFNRDSVDPAPLYMRYPTLRPGPFLLFVGRITPSRNLETLVDAMGIVRERFPTAVLGITGKESDPAYARALRDRVAQRHLESAVLFTGVASWDDLARLYAVCELYVSPSLWEGFLRAEAFAMGKPMVAFDVAANPDTIEDGVNGVLVRGRTPHDLAAAILDLLNDPELAQRLGQNGLHWAQANLDFDRIADRFMALLEDRVPGR